MQAKKKYRQKGKMKRLCTKGMANKDIPKTGCSTCMDIKCLLDAFAAMISETETPKESKEEI